MKQEVNEKERENLLMKVCVCSVLLTVDNPTTHVDTLAHAHMVMCTHVLGDECGESSPRVRVIIILPSITM